MFLIRHIGLKDYEDVFSKMKAFTLERTPKTIDEIWIVEHPAVFTQGQAGRSEHILQKTSIPIIQSDRGGQVTYHGPGQLVVYFLLDCQRNQIGIRELVNGIENLTIALLNQFDIQGEKKCGSPGIYIGEQKIASLGLRIKNHCSYHGLALNVDMDLKPFSFINPCGYKALEMTQMKNQNPHVHFSGVVDAFQSLFMRYIHDDYIFRETRCSISKA